MVTSTPLEKNFFWDFGMAKEKFLFCHSKVPDFRHSGDFLESGLPKKNNEKKMFYAKIMSKLGPLTVYIYKFFVHNF